ncbi:MAG: hypothetical protein IPH37_20250 [Burkholderiales bacterium]|nr:hypothetical protein [Burkholderiales bacterium]
MDLPADIVYFPCPPGTDTALTTVTADYSDREANVPTNPTGGHGRSDPIDRFTHTQVTAVAGTSAPRQALSMGVSEATALGLQRLGTLAGWHHPSPFMVSIDSQWGGWTAYDTMSAVTHHVAPTLTCKGHRRAVKHSAASRQ